MAPNQKRFVLKLANYCECDGCHKTLKRLLKIDGVNSTLIDAKTRELTVSGPVDPQEVITFLEEEGKKAKLVTEEIQAIQPKRNNRRNARIEGVVSIDIDKDLELGKATISGNVDPQTVIKKLNDRAKKHAELLGKEEEEEESPTKINHQEMQIVLQQNPVRTDQRKVAPQPPGLIIKSVDKPMERDIHDCDPKFWSILLTVTCFCAYRSFQFLSDLISKSVDKPMDRDIHDCDPKHDHELELKSYKKPFKCNKCREDGFASGYRCKHCIYDLHKGCLDPEPKITPDFFPESIFKFRTKLNLEKFVMHVGWKSTAIPIAVKRPSWICTQLVANCHGNCPLAARTRSLCSAKR